MGANYILKMSPKTFLKKWSTGSGNVRIRKGNTTKRTFITGLQADDAFMSKVAAVKDEYKIDGDTFANHPKSAEINQRLTSLVKDHAGNQVNVSNGTKYVEAPLTAAHGRVSARPTASERAAKAAGTRDTTSDIVWDVTGVRTKDPRTEWLHTAVAYEIDRFRNHGALTQPKAFSNWDKDPKRAAIQKKLVANLEKMGRAGKFSKLEISGGKGGGEAVPMIELTGLIVNAAAVEAGIETEAERKRVEAERRESAAMAALFDDAVAGIDPAELSEAEGKAPEGKGPGEPAPSGDDSDEVKELDRDWFRNNIRNKANADISFRSYQHQVRERYNELVEAGHAADGTTMANAIADSNRTWFDTVQQDQPREPPEKGFDPSLSTKIPAPPIEGVRKTLEIESGLAKRARQAVAAPGQPGGGGGSQTAEGGGAGAAGRTETDAPPGPPPPPGSETDEERERRRREEEERRRKEPPRGPFTRRPIPPTDDDEPEKDKSVQVDRMKDPKVSLKPPELRPFFQIGGEDSLRISPEEKAREARDWALYNYVPGEAYQSYDNPMTQFEKEQYDYRMYRTYPDAHMVKPTPFDGKAPRTLMRNIYEGVRGVPRFYNAFDNGQYTGRQITNLQDTHFASELLDRATQMHHYPDMAQLAGANYMRGVRNGRLAFLLGSKSLF